jgi:2,3-bisphosphoglycerate-dependent phosphoglycerate mutase
LTLLRHGQSEYNRSRRFTGWADVELTAAGESEARRAGEILATHGILVDRCFTSALRRAARSAEIALGAMGLPDVPIERSWRLNERHYGALQGLGPWSAVRRYGLLPILRARRDREYRPPALVREAAAHEATDESLPTAESLADLRARVAPFWEDRIAPELAAGRSVLVVSHKHALRALFGLVRGRDGRPLRFATGVPIVVTLDTALGLAAHRSLAEIAPR